MTSVERVRVALQNALGGGAVACHRHNHTGAGKLSFAVRRGHARLWAKVAADDAEQASLATWARLAGVLAETYAAPPVLDVLDVDRRLCLVFPYVDAPVATRTALGRRYDEIRVILDRLHADRELAASLGPPLTSAAAFGSTWIERFVEDLDILEGFVDRDLHVFLVEEVETLAGLVAELDGRVHAATHGDPWHENVLLAADRVWLLDWEDLAVGDPVVDDAILIRDAHGTDPRRWPDTTHHAVARRALMLDEVVDVAADWVQTSEPFVRRNKEAAYRAGLDAYRAAYE